MEEWVCPICGQINYIDKELKEDDYICVNCLYDANNINIVTS